MKNNKKTLVIFDAHAIIHRAYHALPNFSSSEGTPTGALYGLSTMLIRIIEEFKPNFVVAAYDLPKPTFRHHAYGAYKAGRMKADEELVAQLETSREIFNAFGVPILDSEGFEADDIIGTIVEKLKKDKDTQIIIASGDMDTLQLVDKDRVKVFTLRKGVTDTVLYDESAVKKRYGLKPIELIEYKGLRGDPSDNIIGVPGIGEKTATTIVQKLGSIENMYKVLDKNPEKLKEAGLTERLIKILDEHRDDALFSKTLATIRRDAPIDYSLPKDSHRQSLDTDGLISILQKYEFRSLLPRVRNLFSIQAPPEIDISVDQNLLLETSVALWVLYSEDTTPNLETILIKTKKKNLSEAYKFILEELEKRGLLPVFEKIEKPLIPIIQKMTDYGIGVDKAHFEKIREKISKEILELEKEIEKIFGEKINLNSPKQLSSLLFDKLKLKTKGKRKASGAFTTNAEALEALRDEHPVISKILEYRELQKLLTTYVEALLGHIAKDGRVHATFYQHGATTGRFSSANPNLQNLPTKGDYAKQIRYGFVAKEGHLFIGADYSQIELRVLAILSGDEKLIETFRKGEDIHSAVASKMFGIKIDEVTQDMRRIAKVINFGILFGMGVTALSKNLNSTRDKAQEFYANYFETFPKVAKYLEETKATAKSKGYTETLFGRRRYFPAINSGAPFLRAFAERMASNAPIQGTEADILKIAILNIESAMKSENLQDKVHLVLQVHDELVYEVEKDVADKARAIIEQKMVSVFQESPIKIDEPKVPITVASHVGDRLDELK